MLFQVAAGSQQLFRTLQAWGFVDALLPFLLLFVLVFAVLQKIGLFKERGEPDRKINGIIAFVLAALVVVPHITRTYPPGADPVVMILQILPSSAILLLAILLVVLMVGFVGGSTSLPTAVISLVLWAALIILGVVVAGAAFPGFTENVLRLDPSTQALIITLLVMGLVIWFVARSPEREKKSFGEQLKEAAEKWF